MVIGHNKRENEWKKKLYTFTHACTHAHSWPDKRSYFRNINIRWNFRSSLFLAWTIFFVQWPKVWGRICNIANCMYAYRCGGKHLAYLYLFGFSYLLKSDIGGHLYDQTIGQSMLSFIKRIYCIKHTKKAREIERNVYWKKQKHKKINRRQMVGGVVIEMACNSLRCICL